MKAHEALRLTVPLLAFLSFFPLLSKDNESVERFKQVIPKASESNQQLDHHDDELAKAMDAVIQTLFVNQSRSHAYIAKYPSSEFFFYVYELPETSSWQIFSKCIENRYNVPEWKQYMTKKIKSDGNQTSNCDWGASICSQVRSSSSEYSSRRFNRNGDVVLSKLFTEYTGKRRTYDPLEASAFIVPYASTAHCACKNDRARCKLITDEMIQSEVLDHLAYYKGAEEKHIFLSSVQRELNHPFMKNLPVMITVEANPSFCDLYTNCGHFIQPYVNTNADFQPNAAVFRSAHEKRQRKYAMAAFLSKSIGDSKVSVRRDFIRSIESTNLTSIAGLPIYVSGLDRRVLENETVLFDVYRDSIFCPCLRGNTPAQKRFFDVLMSGCIPVVLEYEKSSELGQVSYFKEGGTSVRLTYPFAKGIFHGEQEMGIDYSKVILAVNGTCGVACIIPAMEDLLAHNPDKIVEIQQEIGRLARLFTYGMESNGLQYADTVAALLVQIRHFLLASSQEGDNP